MCMTDREKLVELLLSGEKTVQCEHSPEVNCDGMKCAFCERVEIADRLIANGVTFATDTKDGGKWIPVTERLPKQQGFYLVAHQRSGCVAERFYYKDCPDLFVKTTGDPVTHWMPLPEPPKEG